MSVEWKRIRVILEKALELPENERSQFLETLLCVSSREEFRARLAEVTPCVEGVVRMKTQNLRHRVDADLVR